MTAAQYRAVDRRVKRVFAALGFGGRVVLWGAREGDVQAGGAADIARETARRVLIRRERERAERTRRIVVSLHASAERFEAAMRRASVHLGKLSRALDDYRRVVLVPVGGRVDTLALRDADLVVRGPYPDGSGFVLKDRLGKQRRVSAAELSKLTGTGGDHAS